MFLSGSTNGAGILVTGNDSASAVVIDASAISVDAAGDEMGADNQAYFIQATNVSASDVILTLEWGGSAANNLIKQTIAANSGLIPIVGGLALTEPVSIKAYAATADAVVIYGTKQRSAT